MGVVAPVTFEQMHAVQVSQLGQHEDPANSNRTKYGAAYGMNGQPWCDIYQWWCSVDAGWKDAPKFSYTPSHAQFYKDRGAWLPASAFREAPIGSHVFFDFPGDGVNRISHIGWKEGMTASGQVATIEGNTNDAGGRTGGMVMRHNRTVAGGIVGFGVITYQASPPPTVQEDDDMEMFEITDGPDKGKIFLRTGDKYEWIAKDGKGAPAVYYELCRLMPDKGFDHPTVIDNAVVWDFMLHGG